jgi:hypothetical protein
LLYYGVHILPTAQDRVLGATEELPEKLKLNSQKNKTEQSKKLKLNSQKN